MPLVQEPFGDIITFTRASTGTFFNSAGTLTSAAINEARFDYNPSTLVPQGLLIEESRTNSIRNNTMVGAVAGTPGTLPTNWNVSGLGTLTQQVVGTGTSNGITYIDIRFSGTTSTTQLSIRFEPNGAGPIPAANGQTWVASQWSAVIAGSLSNITSRGVNANLWDAGGSFVGGALSGALSATATLTRESAAGTIATVGTAFIQPQIFLGFNSGVAIDITLRIGLPQLELGAFATSVIFTTTTALTRSTDDARVNVLSPWYNQTAGTLFVERIRGPLDPAAKRYVNISDGSAGTNVALQKVQGAAGGSSAVSYVAGVSDFAPNPAGVSAEGAIVKTALAIDNTGKAMSRDGGTVATSAVLPALSGMTTMFIGSQIGAGNTQVSNTWIRRITYYPRRLSNAELQAITT